MESFFGLGTTYMIQYWRSSKDLHSYARNEKHLTPWRNFSKKIGNNDSVGIYHETFKLNNRSYESTGNIPLYGLGKALKHIPIKAEIHSARKRLTNK
ncbi:monooxygenase family protein [Heyndrickxia oleronia]|uniref:DUF4188 domain-containing protein n=1 Tax=Heyndrickxia oleronia TaxID=38875 RepID=A0AAW6SVV4_9BACI|nr:DUF4188 domain-containing protein [Heyndrickxia oleronia]MDH5161408.1 DUF4188 domain-containing protein [Heyndrickxia oleronia]